MFLASVVAGPWQANTYVVGAEPSKETASDQGKSEVVIIDPGVEAFEPVQRVVVENNVTPVGILLTHGHIDHIATATLLADEYQIPVWIHEADRILLTDPAKGLSPESAAMIERTLGYELREPSDLRFFSDGDVISIAGTEFEIVHAPGHTPGCVVMEIPYGEQDGITGILFSGDVLFAGSIGRTDLPGGDTDVMNESLRTKILPLSRTLAVLPGHGPQTSMARELDTNPFLQPSYLGN